MYQIRMLIFSFTVILFDVDVTNADNPVSVTKC